MSDAAAASLEPKPLEPPSEEYFDISDDDLAAWDFTGKVVVITGSSSGIGLATAELFSKKGAIVIAADINPLPTSLPNTTFIKTDVSSWESQTSLFKTAFETNKRVDHVIANAGIAPTAKYTDLTTSPTSGELVEPDTKCVDVNLRGAINTATLGSHYIKQSPDANGGGSIVITGSAASYYYNLATDYSLTKHAVVGYMRGMVTTLSNTHPNIRINTVNPYWTETNIVPKEYLEKMGIKAQPASAVALGIAKLTGDTNCNGWGLFVKDSRFKELDQKLTGTASEHINGKVISAQAAWKRMGGKLGEMMKKKMEMEAKAATTTS